MTCFGNYEYKQISVTEAKELIKNGFQSAVGHQSTCDVLNTLLDPDIEMNRIVYQQQVGETALIFKLNCRAQEGKILTASEIEAMGYTFGRLVRIS